jgi:hypothetical protein
MAISRQLSSSQNFGREFSRSPFAKVIFDLVRRKVLEAWCSWIHLPQIFNRSNADVHARSLNGIYQVWNSRSVLTLAEKLDSRCPLHTAGVPLVTTMAVTAEYAKSILLAPLREIVERIIKFFAVIVFLADKPLEEGCDFLVVNPMQCVNDAKSLVLIRALLEFRQQKGLVFRLAETCRYIPSAIFAALVLYRIYRQLSTSYAFRRDSSDQTST